jgi:hypothetical protein
MSTIGDVAKRAIEKPGVTAMKAISGITLPTIIFWALGKDDEEIQALRRADEGYNNMYWRNPLSGEVVSWRRFWWNYGSIFSTPIEAALDEWYDNDATKHIAQKFANQVIHAYDFNLVPPHAQLAVELMTGQKGLNPLKQSSRITPRYVEGLDPMAQIGPNTSKIASKLAEFGVNPYITDYAINQGFGSLFSKSIMGMSGGYNRPFELRDVPILSSFTSVKGRPTGGGDAFYHDLEKSKRLNRSYNKFMQKGDYERAIKILEDNSDFLSFSKFIDKTGQDINELRKLREQVLMDTRLTDDERRDMANLFYDMMQDNFNQYEKVMRPR